MNPKFMHTVLVLGGYGFFGARIAESLAKHAGIRLLIAGRDEAKARHFAQGLGLPADRGVRLDATAADLAGQLRALEVGTVIHTAGPFQGQDLTALNTVSSTASGCCNST
jgi:short subunit dehydrogenase-like uncharacterized protein